MKEKTSLNNITTCFIQSRGKILWMLPLFLLVVSSLLTSRVLAHKGATGVVKERMDLMDEIGDNMKGMKAMVQRKQPFDAAKMAMHAESVRQASMHIKKVFPEDSLKPPSEALPSIWKDWDKFSSLADKLTAESEKLGEVARSQDLQAVMKQFGRVGKTCRGCHTDFRKKKDKKK